MKNQNNIYAYYPNGNKYGYYNNLSELEEKLGYKLLRESKRGFFYNYLGLNFNIVRKKEFFHKGMFLLENSDIECVVFDEYIGVNTRFKKFLACLLSPFSSFHNTRITQNEFLIVYRDLSIVGISYNSRYTSILSGTSLNIVKAMYNRWDKKIIDKPVGIFSTTSKNGLTIMSREAHNHIKEHYKILY